MCGIAGVFGPAPKDECASIAQRMSDALVHRGPDDSGLWCVDNIGISMRRLSIIDLANGHQPMLSDDGMVIVYNGELYNYRELRKELVADGFVFKTDSDTEVMLNMYRRYGLACVHRLNGMFAACIINQRERKAHLIRDRLGIKPVYYGTGSQRIYFASELKALLAGMDNRPTLNRQALHHYLTFQYVPPPQTMWENIYKLAPGHHLTVDLRDSSIDIQQYWALDFAAEAEEPGRDYLAEFSELFLSAVDRRLLASDVPVGMLLSGGLDSSAVGAAAVELGHRDFHTFNVAYAEGGRFSEAPYARTVSTHIGSKHHEVVIDRDDFINFLPEFVWQSDEPSGALAGVAVHYLSKLAQQHVKVVLAGEGGDEVLCGYAMDEAAKLADKRHRATGWVPKAAFRMLSSVAPHAKKASLNALGKYGWSGYLSGWAVNATYLWSEDEKRALWRDGSTFASSDDLIRSWYTSIGERHPLDQIQQIYCQSWLVENLLMRSDKMTMGVSLELRVPFLDHTLVEWAMRLPRYWKVGDARRGYATKKVLRDFALTRLPASIVDRPKEGFPQPVHRWLKEGLGSWARSRLNRSGSELSKHLEIGLLNDTLIAAEQGDYSAAQKVWVVLILDYWMERWIENAG